MADDIKEHRGRTRHIHRMPGSKLQERVSTGDLEESRIYEDHK
jgi:hypothetical protein